MPIVGRNRASGNALEVGTYASSRSRALPLRRSSRSSAERGPPLAEGERLCPGGVALGGGSRREEVLKDVDVGPELSFGGKYRRGESPRGGEYRRGGEGASVERCGATGAGQGDSDGDNDSSIVRRRGRMRYEKDQKKRVDGWWKVTAIVRLGFVRLHNGCGIGRCGTRRQHGLLLWYDSSLDIGALGFWHGPRRARSMGGDTDIWDQRLVDCDPPGSPLAGAWLAAAGL